MPRLKGRLVRLEKARGVTHDRSHLQFVAQVAMSVYPGIELVCERDTDPWTYAQAEALRARARGDFALSERLEAEFPRRMRPCPPERKGSTLGELTWDIDPRNDLDWERRRRSIQKAIQTARKRMGRESCRGAGGRA